MKELRQILKEHYSMPSPTIKQGKGYNINSKNYLIISDKTKYYLKTQHLKATLIKQIKAMDICYHHSIKTPKIIKTKEDSLFIIRDGILFLLTKFYDGTTCHFTNKEIYSAGEQLTVLNNALKNTSIIIERNQLYDNLNDKQLDDIKQQTGDKKILSICDKMPTLYKKLPEENNIQLVHVDYNLQNVLFKNNEVQVILDFDSIISMPLAQSIAFGCDRFSKSKKNMLTFLRGCISQGFLEEQIKTIPSYVIKEAVCRINYILRTNNWLFDIDKHLRNIKKMEDLEWI